MESLHIEKFEARYHLPPSRFDQKERLNRLLGDMLQAPLAMALERLGISPREEICIRRIHAPVRLNCASADADVGSVWSLTLANRFFEVFSEADPENVVRYTSRLQGLFDFADGVGNGDYRRAWAWKQMGFSVPRRLDSLAEAAKALVATLIREPECIVSVLSHSARLGWFARLLNRIPVVWWRDLAMAALSAHGARNATEIWAPETVGLEKAGIAKRRIASRIVDESSIAVAVCRERSWLGDHIKLLPALAILAILEKEPAVFRENDRETAWLHMAVEEEFKLSAGLLSPVPFVESGKDRSAGFEKEDFEPDTPEAVQKPSLREIGQKLRKKPGTLAENALENKAQWAVGERIPNANYTGAGSGTEIEDVSQSTVEPKKAALQRDFGERRSESTNRASNLREKMTPAGKDRPEALLKDLLPEDASEGQVEKKTGREDTVAKESPFEKRRRGFTEYGGLLFLLNLLEQAGIVDEIAGAEKLEERPFQWFLHALALRFVPVGEKDPAVMAFCGLRPGDSLPWQDDHAPDDTENAMLDDWRARITGKLSELICKGRRKFSAARVLFEICYRKAEILADPGWIEAIFSLRGDSTEIRRAGLDLDPGFIPWLGVVIKFYYECHAVNL